MKKHSAIYVLLLLIILPSNILAATIYMRDGEMHKGRIVGETEEEFFVKLDGESYSIFFTHHEFNKVDIYAIIDDTGMMRYPADLTLIGSDALPISEEEFQRQMAKRRLEVMQDQADSLRGINTILFLQLLLIIGGGVAIAIGSS